MKIFVYHTPELVPAEGTPDCAIAVDILRATTTIATALAAGAEGVQVFSDLNELMRVSEAHPTELRIRVGERGGKTVEGCDLGNSPFDFTPDVVRGKRIFMSTTNGTRSLQKIANAKSVLAAAMINLGSVLKYLRETKPETVWIVGSGWEGSYSLEDTTCAGAIAANLEDEADFGNDEAVAAATLYKAWKGEVEELFYQASHGKRLLNLNCAEDIAYCAKIDVVDVLPKQSSAGLLVAA
jgi:2-phosphosulfolactate phosphatase